MGRRLRATALAVVLAVTGGLMGAVPAVLVTSAPAGASTISSGGPLTAVTTSPDLNCAVNHTGDSLGEFYGDTACGTFAAIGGTLYSPAVIPAGQPGTPWTPVSQVGPTGSGTAGDPYRVVTVVDAGATGVRLTQTDSYIVGQESYRTDVAIANTGASTTTVRLYRAGDCYLQNDDYGFGVVEASGAVACKSQTSDRIEQFLPVTSGSSYLESNYSTVWSTITSQAAFPNTCLCGTAVDNGAGLSWDATIAAGASKTISSILTFSPLGIVPLTVTKTADAASTPAGGTNGYTITVSNPNVSAVTLTSISDTLPTGFTYIPGSTTGATTANPSTEGGLSWSGPFPVPAEGSVSLHFGVTVSNTAGTYNNVATAAATGYTVASTGDTAPITVTSIAPLVVALAPATGSGTVGSLANATATVTRDGAPQSGVSVSFSVISGPNVGAGGSASTNGSGVASFSYTGGPTTGTDTLQATVLDGETTRTSNTVTRTWTPAVVLAVTSDGQPASVTAGADAIRTVTVTNTGGAAATGTSATLTVPAGVTLVSKTPSQGTCGAVVSGVVTCALGTIAAGGSANVNFVLQAPAAVPVGGTFSTSASATSSGGGTAGPAVSTTTVTAPSPGQATGYIPPGGTLKTGTDATAGDNTVSSLTLPNSGPGAIVTISSVPCAPGVCQGKVVSFNAFPGYNDPTKPIKAVTIYDKSLAGPFGQLLPEYVLKEGSTKWEVIPPCSKPGENKALSIARYLAGLVIGGRSGIAAPSPCSDKKDTLSNGDLRYESLFLSGDPARRR